MSNTVSSALSSFLYCCFYPTGGHRHSHRAGAYYYSSHPTSTNTFYYHEGGLTGRRMGRSRPLSLQVCVLCFLSLLFLLALFLCLAMLCMQKKKKKCICSDEYVQVQQLGYATATTHVQIILCPLLSATICTLINLFLT